MVNQTIGDLVLVMFWILEGLGALIFQRSQANIKGQGNLIIKQTTMLCNLVSLLLIYDTVCVFHKMLEDNLLGRSLKKMCFLSPAKYVKCQ